MKQILHIMDSNGIGGAQQLIKGLAQSDKDGQFAFFFIREKSPSVNLPHKKVGFGHQAWKYALTPMLDLFKFVRFLQPYAVHCHLTRSLLAGILLKIRFPGLPIIYHEHGEILYHSPKRDFLLHRMLIWAGKYAISRFIAVSEPVKNALIHCGIQKRDIELLPNFIETNFFQNSNVENKRPGAPFIIGYTGRLNAVKRLDIALKALSGVNFDFRLIIVGDGPDKPRLQRLVSYLSMADVVKFEGYKTDVLSYLRKFDIYILPSDSEAHPVGLLEALAAGIPAVVSRLPAFKEYPQEHPAFRQFKKGSVEDCREQIAEMHVRYEKALAYRNELQRWVQQYSKVRYMEHLHALYRKMKEK